MHRMGAPLRDFEALRCALGVVLCVASLGASVEALAQVPERAPLIQQVFVDDEGVSFVEIGNLTGEEVLIEDFYLATGPGYETVVRVEGPEPGPESIIARFPQGAILPPEGAIVQISGLYEDFVARFGVAPDFTLEEIFVEGTEPLVRLAGDFEGGLPRRQGGLVALFYWDGVSDKVLDSDIVAWGTGASLIDKTGIALDGPDELEEATAYASETPRMDQIVAEAPMEGEALVRVGGEVGERLEGGNGIEGHDETSEDLAAAFESAEPQLGEVGGLSVSGRVFGSGVSTAGLTIGVEETGQSQVLGEDGLFELRVGEPGDYTLVVSGQGVAPNLTVVSVGEGGVEGIEIEVRAGYVLSGSVVASDTMAGLEGARVAIVELGIEAVSGAEGGFAFEAVAPGVYTIEVEAEGYVGASRVVEVVADTALELELEVERRFALSLRVQTPGGPGVGAVVQVTGGISAGGFESSAGAGGEVVFEELVAGIYAVSVALEGHQSVKIEAVPLSQDAALTVMLVPLTRAPLVTDKGCAVASGSGGRAGGWPLWAMLSCAALWSARRSRREG